MSKKKITGFIALLVITLLSSFVFCFVDQAAIGPCGTTVGLSHINDTFRTIFPYNHLIYVITQLLGYVALLVCVGFACIGLAQLIGRKSLLKVDPNIYALGALYVITIVLYVLFDKFAINYRPILMDGEIMPEASFPSSHTLLALVVYCSAPMVLKKYLGKKPIYPFITTLFYLLAIAMVVGRMASGVHWFTDIVAGVLIGSCLLYMLSLTMDALKPGKKAFYLD